MLFWERIYGHYGESQALIHDSQDLSMVFDVLELLDPEFPAATRLNSRIRKEGVEHYREMLLRLSKSHSPQNGEEKRIFLHYGGKKGSHKLAAAAEHIRVQTGLKERFTEGVVRSGRYISSFKNIFSSYGLPQELAYLPHVESSFNNAARSSVGASGMWQFTRATGLDYLTITDLVDQRSDPFVAADAAARYLKRSYEVLKDWPLALTSYNYGRSGMLRAQKAKGSYPQIFASYNEGYFKFASRNFYPEFLAALKVAQRLEKNNAIIKERPKRSIIFVTKGYLPSSSFGRLAKIPERIIAEYNPALSRLILQGRKYIPPNTKIYLPYTAKTRWLIKHFPGSAYKGAQPKDSFYYVKSGDTVSKIARRFGISAATLSQINGLNSNGHIRIGQFLILPIKK